LTGFAPWLLSIAQFGNRIAAPVGGAGVSAQ
jgi:hypothetical protein